MESPHTPPEIAKWLGRAPVPCGCGRSHQIPIKSVFVGSCLLDSVEDLLPDVAKTQPPLILADPHTWEAAGSAVNRRLKRAGLAPRELLTAAKPHADDHTLDELRSRLDFTPSMVIAVGAGTINDLAKMLARDLSKPQVTVATAASMNGYTSAIAAMTVGGLKKTLPVDPPQVIVVDTDVLAAAPKKLNAAGFGDLLSKPVSGADWVLSDWLFGETVCPTAISIADQAVARTRQVAAGIKRGDADALAVLSEALLLSGLSMSLAGASSPASGGEHLISHYLDISAESWQREPLLHGEQVAVGTLVSLQVYQRLRQLGPQPAQQSAAPLSLRDRHAHLPQPAFDELAAEAAAKEARTPDRNQRQQLLASRWDELWQRLDTQLAAGHGTRDALIAAGAPSSFSDINVSPDLARATVLNAREMRNRFTILDLAADLNHLDAIANHLATW